MWLRKVSKSRVLLVGGNSCGVCHGLRPGDKFDKRIIYKTYPRVILM